VPICPTFLAPGKLCLDDDALAPEELRAAYRIMRNAGYVPEPVRCAAELAQLPE